MCLKNFILFGSIVVLFFSIINPAFALSPVFDREIIKDQTREYEKLSEDQIDKFDFFIPDIKFVTYSSDGKFFNFTIWLDKEFLPKNVNTSGSTFLYFGAAFDTDSTWETGSDGADYLYSVGYNMPLSRDTWSLSLMEFADSKNSITKIIKTNMTEIVNSDYPDTISLSVDLKDIGNYPDQYRVNFASFMREDYDVTSVSSDHKPGFFTYLDTTWWEEIPKSNFILNANPETAVIRAGDEQIFELKLETNAKTEREVIFSMSQPSEQKNWKIETLGNKTILPANGFVTIPMKIIIPENTKPGPYTVPISSEIIFPKTIIPKEVNSESLFPDPVIGQLKSQEVHSSIGITVDEKLTHMEKFLEIINPLEGVVSIFTALAAILGGFIMWIWSRYKNKSETKIVESSE